MNKQIVLANDSISVWYYPELGIVHHEMHRYTRGKDFRDALRAGTETLTKNHASKWLSDNRAHIVLPPEDEQWAKTEWFPATRQAGWKYWAIVQPGSAVGQMNMRRIIDAYAAQGVTAHIFTDPAEAMTWLRACGT
jgi:hypothetical protein